MSLSRPRPVVGLSANVIDPSLTGGRVDGIGRYTLALEAELRALGVATSRVHAQTRTRWRAGRPPPPPAFAVPLPVAIAAGALFRVAAPGTAIVESAIDVYHATDYLVPRLSRTPVVATLYDAIPLAHPEWANRKLRLLKNRILRWGARNADRVICTSRAAVPEIVEHYAVPEDRIRVIPLGVDPHWALEPPPGRAERSAAARSLRPGYLLFVGTLQPRKNVAMLLDAFDRLPDALRGGRQLVIVGRYGWGVESLRADLVRRRASGEVVWLDDVDDATLRDLYASAGCFVFPSLSEGFGLPLLEALAAGLPVIASDLPVLREVAASCAEYVPADDVDAWVDALSRAPGTLTTEAMRETHRAHALAFGWRSCSEQTLAVYREVL